MNNDLSIIKIQRNIEIIDGEERWNRLEYVKDHKWCCEALQKSDFTIDQSGKFGDPQYKYCCGEDEFDYTEEIKNCPYCGKEILVRELPPIKKIGKKEWDVLNIRGCLVKKTNPRIVYEDGTIDDMKGKMHTCETIKFVPDQGD
jgi:DNA-directed RNA polymerase subunit RPC12/RpoP